MKFTTILVILLTLILGGVIGLIIEELSPGSIPEIAITILKLTVIIGTVGMVGFMLTFTRGSWGRTI